MSLTKSHPRPEAPRAGSGWTLAPASTATALMLLDVTVFYLLAVATGPSRPR